jgi:ATP-dependent Clp protease protease subunit
MIKANELSCNTDTYVDFLTDFTGKERDEIYQDVGRTRWFTPKAAIEYGLIDKVVEKGLTISEKKDYEQMLAQAQAQAAGAPGSR